jgi:hypothetical protein
VIQSRTSQGRPLGRGKLRIGWNGFWKISLTLILSVAALPLAARAKDRLHYGGGLIVNVPFPESEVAQVVQDVIQNGIIRGTKEYNKDQYVTGATAAGSTAVFKQWAEGGKVFYKVRLQALDPRNFKDSGDVGTLAVRYVVQPQGDKNTVLRIDAVFVEDFRRVSHLSNGSVESAEYQVIHDRLEAIELMKAEAAEVEKQKQEKAMKKQRLAAPVPSVPTPASATQQSHAAAGESAQAKAVSSSTITGAANSGPAPSGAAQSPVETLEQHVQNLRRQVERVVRAPGAALKSAPFHTATTLQSLSTGTEVLIVISTPHWFGVETHEGQHGWILRDELELMP